MTTVIHWVIIGGARIFTWVHLVRRDAHKIITTDIINPAVAIIIDTRGSVIFRPVGPDGAIDMVRMGAAQIGVGVVDTGVQHSDYNVGITQGLVPGTHSTHVRSTDAHIAQEPLGV